MQTTTARQEYWRRNVRLKLVLLVIWFVVSFGFGILFVDQLNEISLGDFQLGFWFAQQGSIYTFVVLIGVYAWKMDGLDRELGADEENGGGPGGAGGDGGDGAGGVAGDGDGDGDAGATADVTAPTGGDGEGE